MTLWVSAKRNRVYKRKFDHDEARKRVGKGESMTALAREYGVSKRAIEQVLTRIPVGMVPIELYCGQPPPPGKDRCSMCQGFKQKSSALCLTCFNDHRLAPIRLERVPGQKRAMLGGVRFGSVVCYHGEWGVVDRASIEDVKHRWVDFWDAPARLVSLRAYVEVAPYFRVVEDKIPAKAV